MVALNFKKVNNACCCLIPRVSVDETATLGWNLFCRLS